MPDMYTNDTQGTDPHDGHAVRWEPSTGDVLLVTGDGKMATYPLDRDAVVIGRDPQTCDIAVEHRELSRRHVLLRRLPAPSIQDLGSTNGTRLGEVVLHGGVARSLDADLTFHIGTLSFIVVRGRTRPPPSRRDGRERLLVEDPTPEGVSRLIREIATSGVNVLIQGETGVGKEILATTLHEMSGRAGRLTRLNCAALSETLLASELFGHEKGAFTGAVSSKPGLLEASAGGSVFLDEIGELPPNIQAKLLRAVEAREVLRVGSTKPIAIDVRFIAATNRDLPAEVEAGRFRDDLYFRLDGVSLHIPPLRERRAQIAPLALRFLAIANSRFGLASTPVAPDLIAALESHTWPGNVRELKAVIERAVLLAHGGELAVQHLVFARRASTQPPLAPDEAVAEPDERARICAALDACAGNQTRAARMLGMPRSTLIRRLDRYQVTRPRPRGDGSAS